MSKKALLYLSVVIGSVYTIGSCCNNYHPEEAHGEEMDTVVVDTIVVDPLMIDTGQYVDDDSSNASIIEEKYGKQWDFCDCVVKNDSVQQAIENAGDDADFDAIIARMDEIDLHCKEMLTTPNKTPEERDAHERKVRKCLKNAK